MKLSVLTINYNNSNGLQKTIDSVAIQTYTEFEHIIVDGNGYDEGVRIIQEYDYAQRISGQPHPLIRWISEIYNGIYNAMNKGIRMCQGEYVLILNSGDSLVDEHVLERIIPVLDGTDIVQGNAIEEYNGKLIQNRGYGRSEITMRDVLEGNFLHQASFCRKDLFVRYGYFDESYATMADKKFFMTCLGLHDASFKYVDIDVANFDVNGICSFKESRWCDNQKEEYQQLMKEIFSLRLKTYMDETRELEKLKKHKCIWSIVQMFIKR